MSSSQNSSFQTTTAISSLSSYWQRLLIAMLLSLTTSFGQAQETSGDNGAAEAAGSLQEESNNVLPQSKTAAVSSEIGKLPNIVSRKFGDWFYRCVKSPEVSALQTDEKCEIVQVSEVEFEGQQVNILTLALDRNHKDPNRGKLSVLLPLNVYLPGGFKIAVDNSQAEFSLAFRNCSRAGCWLVEEILPDMLQAFKAGNTGHARFRLMNGQNVQVKFSLSGFTAAQNALVTKLELEQ